MSSRVTSPINRQPHQLGYTSLTSTYHYIKSPLKKKKKTFQIFWLTRKPCHTCINIESRNTKHFSKWVSAVWVPANTLAGLKRKKRKSQKMNFWLELFSPSALEHLTDTFPVLYKPVNEKSFLIFLLNFPVCEGCVSGVTLSITCVAVHIIYNTGRQRGHSNRREPSDP